ncbi:cytochrome P450 [Nocardioides aurantiacus]|uniref:cytochrome P450 n=1 Tax=Nocardioides aurantiacus TaxID=86796 RepID=UPI00403FB37E
MGREIAWTLLRHGYDAVARTRAAAGGGAWFEARMLGRRALVVCGEEGVRTFYDPGLVTRRGAIPAPLRLLLFGRGAVHGLDGDRHRQRKQLFLDVVDRESTERLAREVSDTLLRRMATWDGQDRVHLYDVLVEVYGAAVLRWAGIDVDAEEERRTSHDLATIVDAFGVRGTSYLRGYLARHRANRWARRLVREERARDRPTTGTVLGRVAAERGLSDAVAAVELLNVLRPTVAVAYFGAFAAHALELRPDWRDRCAAGDPADLWAFGHEVRRLYPFVPLLPGRLLRRLVWQGRSFPRGSFMVLDVQGTNRDPARWDRPGEFDPARFVGREPGAFDYVPQGGGDPAHGHRCPGEPLAVGILEVTVRELARTSFRLEPDSRAVPLRRVPSLPAHGVELRDVRRPVRLGVVRDAD